MCQADEVYRDNAIRLSHGGSGCRRKAGKAERNVRGAPGFILRSDVALGEILLV
jgi:hypothetical protein